MLYFQDLFYISKVMCSEWINRHQNDTLAGYFGIEKTQELIARKYYWSTLRRDVKGYIKRYEVCLTSKAVCYKLYGDPESLLVLMNQLKDLSTNFVTSLPISAN